MTYEPMTPGEAGAHDVLDYARCTQPRTEADIANLSLHRAANAHREAEKGGGRRESQELLRQSMDMLPALDTPRMSGNNTSGKFRWSAW